MVQNIILFGATGSIGTSTLNVIRRNRDKFKIIGISCHSNLKKLSSIAHEFNVKNIGIFNHSTFCNENIDTLFPSKTQIFYGIHGNCELASHPDADTVIMAIPGTNGILPTLSAIKAKKNIILASKEVLVVAGEIIMHEAHTNDVTILPIDSEHNAIFQCLKNERKFLKKIILTASGGPFRNYTSNQMKHITVDQALKHPNWQMGTKITIDSATMANKGFEMIEAKWLFGLSSDGIEVTIHPESIIHSMVEFCDGSILAQLSPHNMEYPISHCLFYPNRVLNNPPSISFDKILSLNFSPPNYLKFPCLQIARNCLLRNDASSAIFEAANDIAVQAFLSKKIDYLDIAHVITETLNVYHPKNEHSIEGILHIVKEAQYITETKINKKFN